MDRVLLLAARVGGRRMPATFTEPQRSRTSIPYFSDALFFLDFLLPFLLGVLVGPLSLCVKGVARPVAGPS